MPNRFIGDLAGTLKSFFRITPGTGSSGPPTTGTHVRGEIYKDSLIKLYLCTDSGTPGTWKEITTTFDEIKRCGFNDPTDTTFYFNDTDYSFVIQGTGETWTYYRNGTKVRFTGAKSVTLPGTPPASGLWYISIGDDTPNLTASQTPWDLTDTSVIPVAIILFNNSLTPKYYLADERHSILIDRRSHYLLHNIQGAKLISGGDLSGFSIDTDTDSAHTFGVAACKIIDEDIIHNNNAIADPDGATLAYTILYRTGASSWAWKRSDQPFSYTGAGRVEWDNGGTLTAGTGGPGSNTRWINTYLLQTNLDGDAEVVIVPGQAIHSSLEAAQSENPLNFTWTGLPVAEFVIAWKLVWKLGNDTSKGLCELDVNPIALNIGGAQISSVSGSTQHNALSGLQGGTAGEYYHLTYTQLNSISTVSRTWMGY